MAVENPDWNDGAVAMFCGKVDALMALVQGGFMAEAREVAVDLQEEIGMPSRTVPVGLQREFDRAVGQLAIINKAFT